MPNHQQRLLVPMDCTFEDSFYMWLLQILPHLKVVLNLWTVSTLTGSALPPKHIYRSAQQQGNSGLVSKWRWWTGCWESPQPLHDPCSQAPAALPIRKTGASLPGTACPGAHPKCVFPKHPESGVLKYFFSAPLLNRLWIPQVVNDRL